MTGNGGQNKMDNLFIRLQYLVLDIFEGVNTLVRETEYSFATMLATIVPWTTLFIPALMTASNVKTIYPNTPSLQWVTGFNVFGLGIAAVSTTLMLYQHNRKNSRAKKAEKFPWWIIAAAGSMYIFYLAIVITVNVVMHNNPNADAVFWANMGLALLEVIAVAVAVMRMMLTDILKGQKQEERESAYITYDWRSEVGNAYSIEEKYELYLGGQGEIRRRFPDCHADIPRKWMGYLERDLHDAGMLN